MNVYAIVAFGNYGGGVAIVCATLEREAVALAREIRDRQWNTDYGDPTTIELLQATADGEPRVLFHFETGE